MGRTATTISIIEASRDGLISRDGSPVPVAATANRLLGGLTHYLSTRHWEDVQEGRVLALGRLQGCREILQ